MFALSAVILYAFHLHKSAPGAADTNDLQEQVRSQQESCPGWNSGQCTGTPVQLKSFGNQLQAKGSERNEVKHLAP